MIVPTCEMAFKEWAVICSALAQGKQTLILRKGGIHEGHAGFRVAHKEFWLFPTYLHQDEQEKLVPEAWPELESTIEHAPQTDRIRLQCFAEVTDVVEIADEIILPRLAGLHWWSEKTVSDRFSYRNPGLFLLVVRIFKLSQILEIPTSPHFDGCRSWVDLPLPLSTADLKPVLNDTDFQKQRFEILNFACQSIV